MRKFSFLVLALLAWPAQAVNDTVPCIPMCLDGTDLLVPVCDVQVALDAGATLGTCDQQCPGGGEGEQEGEAGEGEGGAEGEVGGEGEEGEQAGEGEVLNPGGSSDDELYVKGSSFFTCQETTPAGFASMAAMLLFLAFAGKRRRDGFFILALFIAGNANAEGFEHFQPTPGSNNYYQTDDAVVLPAQSASGWVLFNWSHDPVVLRDSAGVEKVKIIENLVSGQAGASVGFFDWLEVGAAVPVVYMNGPAIDGFHAFGAGDARVQAKFGLIGKEGGFNLGLKLRADLPLSFTGGAEQEFFGDPFPTLTPSVLLGWRADWFRLGGEVGYTGRADKTIAGLPVSQSLNYSVGAEAAAIKDTLFVVADVFGSTSPNIRDFERTPVPLEAVLGVKYMIGPWLLTGGAGTGIIPDIGAPDFRLFAGFGFTVPEKPRPKPVPEPAAPKLIVEKVPPVPPVPPKEPEVPPAPRDPPLVVLHRDRIEILEPIYFEFDSAVLKQRSQPVLDQVATVLLDHPEITLVSIEGHASSEGSSAYNLALSQRRAQTVLDYLVSSGVSANRLRCVGYGEEKPIADNRTETGREQNRRVEFRILTLDEVE